MPVARGRLHHHSDARAFARNLTVGYWDTPLAVSHVLLSEINDVWLALLAAAHSVRIKAYVRGGRKLWES